MNNNLKIITLISNLTPLIGVFLFDWSVFSLIFLYWMESFIIGFFAVLKMSRAKNRLYWDTPTRSVKEMTEDAFEKQKKLLIPFFFLHYGLFLSGYSWFLKELGENEPVQKISYALPILFLFMEHAFAYRTKFVGERKFEKSVPIGEMFAPYKRVLVLHGVVILGSFIFGFFKFTQWSNVIPFFILVLLKTLLEVKTLPTNIKFEEPKKMDGLKVLLNIDRIGEMYQIQREMDKSKS